MKGRLWVVAGLFLLMTHSSRLTTAFAAADDSTNLHAAFLRGEYGLVISKTEAILEKGSSREDELLYLQGMSALKVGDCALARASLSRLVEDHPASPWRALGLLGIGTSFEMEGKPEEALQAYTRLLDEKLAKEISPQVNLRLCRLQQRLGLWEPARQGLERLVAAYPATPEAQEAREILQSGDFYFCVQVGAFATKSNAARLVAELDRLGFKAELSQAALNGGLFHRVRVGRFSKREEAQREAQRLQSEGFPAKVFP